MYLEQNLSLEQLTKNRKAKLAEIAKLRKSDVLCYRS